MYVVGKTNITDDIADAFFACDLLKCKGACCEEGDLGAPLLQSELKILEDILPDIESFLEEAGLKEIEKQGTWVKDYEGDFSTPIIKGKACVYAVKENGFLKCGIEKAWLAKKTHFRKPISCQLYPLRVTTYDHFETMNYHRWNICSDACKQGERLQIPLYVFLKDPLVRQYGEEWYKELSVQIVERKQKI